MSLQYNDTTNRKGIIQLFEKEIGANFGDISNNTNRLKDVTADVNLAIDSYLRLAFPVDGKWKLDDSNHGDLPEIVTDLIAGQRNYTFTEDEQNNLLLDIFKVYIKTGETYNEITPVDPDSEAWHTGFYNGLDQTGVPQWYDKTANIIVLDPISEIDVEDGLKVSINREASYFTSGDTTKKPGFPGIHHAYFYLKPAEDYARRNTLSSYQRIQNDLFKLENEIKAYYGKRNRDERKVLQGRIINYR